MARIRDANGVIDVKDDLGVTCFVDDLDNTTCEGDPFPPQGPRVPTASRGAVNLPGAHARINIASTTRRVNDGN